MNISTSRLFPKARILFAILVIAVLFVAEIRAGEDLSPAWQDYQNGNLAEARDAFGNAIKKNPQDGAAHFGMEVCDSNFGQYRKAYSHAVEAVRYGDSNAEFEIILADALELARFAETPDELTKALTGRLDDKTLTALQRLAVRYTLASLLQRSGRLAEAIEVYKNMPFLRRGWQVLGPFSNREREGYQRDHGLEAELPKLDLKATYGGRNGKAAWVEVADLPVTGIMDINALFHPGSENVAYVTTTVTRKEASTSHIMLGAGGAVTLWINGKKISARDDYFSYHPLQRIFTVDLQAGENRILVKIAGEREGECKFSLLYLPRLKLDDDVAKSTSATDVIKNHSGRNWGAMGYFLKHIADDPEDALAHSHLGYLMLMRGMEDSTGQHTRPLFEKAAMLRPACPLFLELAALVQRDANKGRNLLEKVIAANPDEIAAQELLLRQLHSGGLIRKAEALAKEILAKNNSSVATEIMGHICRDRNWQEEAQKYYRRACDLQPGKAELHSKIAEVAAGRQGRLAALEEGYRRTGNGDILQTLVPLLLESNPAEAERSRQLLQEHLQLEPWNLALHFLRRDVELAKGDFEAAREVLLAATKRLPNHPALLEALGELELHLDRREEAAKLWQRALAIQPDNPDLRQYLQRITPQKKRFFDAYDIEADDLLKDLPAAEDYPRHNMAVLLDQGVVRVNRNGTADKMIHFLQLALTQKGAQQAASHGMPYDPERERVEVLIARVFQPDGSVVAADSIRDQEGGTRGPAKVYNRYTYKKISFSQVMPGSVVEIKYLVEATGENLFGDDFEDGFFFGSKDPTRRFEYILDTPENFDVVVNTHLQEQAGVEFTEETKEKRRIRIYRGHDIPGLELEPGMPPYQEIAPGLRASSFKSWDEVGRWYWLLAEDAFDLPEDIAIKARELVADCKNDREKLAAIYYHVIDRVRYVGVELGRSSYVPHRAERTYRGHYGDCKDTAVLFVSLLKAVGIPANVVLIRTWDRGQEPTGLPGAQRFNHAICYVPPLPENPQKDYWLDGTTDYNHFSEVPIMDQGGMAVIISPDGGKQVILPEEPAAANRQKISYTATLSPDGSGVIELRFDYSGALAASYRRIFEAPERFRKSLEMFFGSRLPGSEMIDFTHSGSDLKEKEVYFTAKLKVPNLAPKSGKGRRFKPWLLPTMFSRRYAAQTERKHDLIIGLGQTHELSARIVLPAGMTASSLPEELNEKKSFGVLNRKASLAGNIVSYHQESQLRVRRLPRDDYPEFREFCNAVDSAEEEWLVFENTDK